VSQVQAQEFESVAVDALKPHPSNPRKGDVGAIVTSIEANGFYGAVVAQRSTGYILAGNHRWMAAKESGLGSVPVLWLDVDDDRAKRILLADNRTNDLASYNDAALAEILAGLSPDFAGTGYAEADLAKLIAGMAGEAEEGPEAKIDQAAELAAKWGTERGQVWLIGRHRLMCGDSTSAEDVGRLMAGAKAGMVFTDPPYGVNYDGGTTVREKLAGDDSTDLYAPCCQMAAQFSEKDAGLYLWHAGVKGIAAVAAAAAAAAGYEIRCEIVWNKNQAQFGALSAQYKQKHEPAYYCFKKGTPPRWFGPTNEVTVWDVDRSSVNEYHPTQKPVELAARAMRNSSRAGDVVLDLFLGSGATMVAAEQLNRTCYGMEIDPGYCGVILERMSEIGLECRLDDGREETNQAQDAAGRKRRQAAGRRAGKAEGVAGPHEPAAQTA